MSKNYIINNCHSVSFNETEVITYYKKIRKAVSVKQAAQFYQLEYYFLNIIRATIFENIPFIGELDIQEE